MVICRYFYYSDMKDYWNSLNMYERNELIKTAVKNGFRDPIEIRRKYNEFAEGGELEDKFINPYKHGDVYNVSPECAYFSNHTLNDQGYMMSGNAWTPRGVDVVFNGFNSDLKPDNYNETGYDTFARDAVNNVYTNFITRETLDPNQVYTVNMFYKDSPNKEKAFQESNGAYGTHTGYLNYEPEDDTWYVTHNIHNKIYKQRFGDLQNPKGNVGVTAIYKPRKNNLFNRVRTKLGFAEGGYLDTTQDKEQESRDFQKARIAEIYNHPDRHKANLRAPRIEGGSSEFDKARGYITQVNDALLDQKDMVLAMQQAREKEGQHYVDDFKETKRHVNNLANSLEFTSAAYLLGNGLLKLGKYGTYNLGTTYNRYGMPIRNSNNPYIRISNKLNDISNQMDKGQTFMNSIGFGADIVQEATEDTDWINKAELVGDAAGVLGGTNIIRNTPWFGRHRKAIDTALDVMGYSAAGYDFLNYLDVFPKNKK